jgi:predicted dehydrogenase
VINVGVIGTGYIGPIHIEALRRMSGINVKSVCDTNRELAAKTAVRYNIEEIHTDFREIINDGSIDVVHVCSPNRLHYDMNKAAILAGKHIMSEKPLAMTFEEAARLTELSDKKGTVTGINFCYRYYPLILEMALRGRSSDAGIIRMVTGTWFQDWLSEASDWTWRLDKKEAGASNIAADLGSHWFDLVQFISGLDITEVMSDFSTIIPVRKKPAGQVLAFRKTLDKDGCEVKVELEEYAAVLFRLSNGAPGSFTTCQAAHGRKSDIEVEVYGSEYSMAWDHSRSNNLWIGYRNRANEILTESPSLQNTGISRYATLPAGHPLGYNDAVLNLFRDFYDAVESGGRESERLFPRPTFASGMIETRILKAVIQSAESRLWVKV